MADPIDPLASLEALSQQLNNEDATIRQSLKGLETKLASICRGADVHCSSSNRVLAQYGPDDYYRGHLYFNGSELKVAYRSTDDDIMDSYDRERDDGPTYSIKTIDECPIAWLRALLEAKSLNQLLPQIGEQLNSQLSATKSAASEIDQIAMSPTNAVASGFEKVAKSLGFDRVVADWKNAQSAVHTNPDAAITRASSLVEGVCKHILAETNTPLPSTQDMQGLYKAATKSLRLDADSQANDDLTGLCRGLTSVAQNIGTLRTHFGDAHGRGPSQKALLTSHAQLAVTAAGAISTFLMERLADTKGTKST